MNINSLINRFFGRDDLDASKNMAKERLRLVLVHDRLDFSEQMMNALREDLLNVIGKYFGIDEKSLDVSFSREPNGMALMANIPVRRHKPDIGNSLSEQKANEDSATKTDKSTKKLLSPSQVCSIASQTTHFEIKQPNPPSEKIIIKDRNIIE